MHQVAGPVKDIHARMDRGVCRALRCQQLGKERLLRAAAEVHRQVVEAPEWIISFPLRLRKPKDNLQGELTRLKGRAPRVKEYQRVVSKDWLTRMEAP